jgi:hypothetical protein
MSTNNDESELQSYTAAGDLVDSGQSALVEPSKPLAEAIEAIQSVRSALLDLDEYEYSAAVPDDVMARALREATEVTGKGAAPDNEAALTKAGQAAPEDTPPAVIHHLGQPRLGAAHRYRTILSGAAALLLVGVGAMYAFGGGSGSDGSTSTPGPEPMAQDAASAPPLPTTVPRTRASSPTADATQPMHDPAQSTGLERDPRSALTGGTENSVAPASASEAYQGARRDSSAPWLTCAPDPRPPSECADSLAG